ncbi:MAG TPA: HNH endonuclease [bacterium]|nr:HNH endonuclease [bacterium]
MPEMNCAQCDITFYTEPWQVKRGRKYCGKKCSGIAKTGVPLSDETKDKIRAASPRRSGWHHTKESKKLIGSGNYKGSTVKDQAGRRRARIMYPEALVCERCGRKKTSTRISRHHVDGDPLNNKKNNIEFLCASCHVKEHQQRREKCL